MELIPKTSNREVLASREIIVSPPISEVFCDVEKTRTMWPQIARENKDFLPQVEHHARRAEEVVAILDTLPTGVDYNDLLEKKLITPEDLARLYDHISELLGDPLTQRLLLYLPLEMIPDQTRVSRDPDLVKSMENFTRHYMIAWTNLLDMHDVRANFIDGDVPEVKNRTQELERVVKAAHFSGILVEKGILCESDIETLIAASDDSVLTESLRQGMTVKGGLWKRDDSTPSQHDFVMSPDRKRWLEQVAREESIVQEAEKVAELAMKGEYVINDETLTVADIEGLYRTIEALVFTGKNAEARELYEQYIPRVAELLKDDDKYLSRALRKLERLGVISMLEMTSFGVHRTYPEGPSSRNLEFLGKDIKRLREVVSGIEQDPFLAQRLYPLVVIGGSRLKGYGEDDSDIDVGIFIKPQTTIEDREAIYQALMQLSGVDEDVVPFTEFWLREAEGYMNIGDGSDSHYNSRFANLFLGSLIGREEVKDEIQQKLLADHFRCKQEQGMYLERLEQDTLQYRLLHKGYARHFPAHKYDHRLDRIDGKSTFWDPGFRKLATKLFVQRVFLPSV